jgi:hypothetical protein
LEKRLPFLELTDAAIAHEQRSADRRHYSVRNDRAVSNEDADELDLRFRPEARGHVPVEVLSANAVAAASEFASIDSRCGIFDERGAVAADRATPDRVGKRSSGGGGGPRCCNRVAPPARPERAAPEAAAERPRSSNAVAADEKRSFAISSPPDGCFA